MHHSLLSGANCFYVSLVVLIVCFGAFMIVLLTGLIIASTKENQYDGE
jgi:hypothetical protein